MEKYALFAVAILAVVIASGCTEPTGQVVSIGDAGTGQQGDIKICPSSCDDGNECTADSCSEETSFECRHVPKWGFECGDNGVCQDGACVEKTDDCASDMNKDACYNREYITNAVKAGDTSYCDEIGPLSYVSLCYGKVALDLKDLDVCENAPKTETQDQCYLFYAEERSKVYIYEGAACESINDAAMREECMAIDEKVTAAAGIKSFDAWIDYDTGKIYSLLVLRDSKGRTAVSDGVLKIFIMQEDPESDEQTKETLYSRTYVVKESDFRETMITGLGSVLAYIPDTISADDLLHYPTDNRGMFYLTFSTPEGMNFHAQKELDF